MRKLAVLLGAVAALTFGTAAQAANILSGTYTIQTYGSQTVGGALVALGNGSSTVTSGNLDIDTSTGAFSGGTVNLADFTLVIDATTLILGSGSGLVVANLSMTGVSHGSTIPAAGTPLGGGAVDYASGVIFDQAGGSVSCSGNALICGGAPSSVFPLGPSNAFVATVDGVTTTTIIFDSGVIPNGSGGDQQSITTLSVVLPEPASLILLGGSLAGLAFLRRRAA